MHDVATLELKSAAQQRMTVERDAVARVDQERRKVRSVRITLEVSQIGAALVPD